MKKLSKLRPFTLLIVITLIAGFVGINANRVNASFFDAPKKDAPTETPVALQNGTYDDTHSEIIYTGWIFQNTTGNYNNTEHYSPNIGDTAVFHFSGKQITIVYRTTIVYGNLGVNVDGVDIGTINQTTSKDRRGMQWTSPLLPPGNHTVTLTHLDGVYTSLDAIIVSPIPTPLPSLTSSPTSTMTRTPTSIYSLTPTLTKTPTRTPTITPTTAGTPAQLGFYDDTFSGLLYSPDWKLHKSTAYYFGTEHYSYVPTSTVNFSFVGDVLSIFYRRYVNCGTLGVTIDGVNAGTINQYSPTMVSSQWSSASFGYGLHHVTLTHLTGSVVLFDAFYISSAGTNTPTITNTPTVTNTPTENSHTNRDVHTNRNSNANEHINRHANSYDYRHPYHNKYTKSHRRRCY